MSTRERRQMADKIKNLAKSKNDIIQLLLNAKHLNVILQTEMISLLKDPQPQQQQEISQLKLSLYESKRQSVLKDDEKRKLQKQLDEAVLESKQVKEKNVGLKNSLLKHAELQQQYCNKIRQLKLSLYESKRLIALKDEEKQELQKLLDNTVSESEKAKGETISLEKSLREANVKIEGIEKENDIRRNRIDVALRDLNDSLMINDKLSQEKEDLQNQLDSAVLESEEVKERNVVLENSLREVNVKIDELETMNDMQRAQIDSVLRELNNIEIRKHELQKQLDNTVSESEKVKGETMSLDKSLREANLKIAEIEEENDIQRNQIDVALQDLNNSLMINAKLSQEKEDLQNQLDSAVLESKEVNARNVALENSLRDVNVKIEDLETENDIQRNQIDTALRELNNSSIRKQELQKQLDNTVLKANGLENSVREATVKIKQLENMNDTQRRQISIALQKMNESTLLNDKLNKEKKDITERNLCLENSLREEEVKMNELLEQNTLQRIQIAERSDHLSDLLVCNEILNEEKQNLQKQLDNSFLELEAIKERNVALENNLREVNVKIKNLKAINDSHHNDINVTLEDLTKP